MMIRYAGERGRELIYATRNGLRRELQCEGIPREVFDAKSKIRACSLPEPIEQSCRPQQHETPRVLVL